MSFSIYDITIPVFRRGFTVLSAVLDKGLAHASAEGVDPATYVEARLAPDMLPLSGQVQRASDTAKACAARLTGLAAPSFPDEETSFEELQARIGRTVDYLASVDPAAFEGGEERQVTLRSRAGETPFVGRDYALQHALPNFFFHVTTAYGILRMKGVPVGKRDYLGF
ncbi:DUF1993 domain-containing protein [Kaistia geumhonensis]|uniref:DUF1993 domain-containing protein n=1 Tax=Kaistia geumhonensis TaxID=410839 RepID=A0ABU0M5N3_9HYPH|nr:DUF1993 domain-containing protein [Kaistia geumhonensis]MCX5478521.1 DUF1993 domain-containing protein [Kaistia geumhonensis]MDQ0516261.1 hypothetical protein [Kaistia geumhonensis]